MFKKLPLMLCASVFVWTPFDVNASDKVLSPISPWQLTNGDQARHCSLSAEYENDIRLAFNGKHGQVMSLNITDASATFSDGETSQANIMMMPAYNVVVEAVAEGTNSIKVNTMAAQGFFQTAGASFLLEVRLPEQAKYSFSLVGLKDALRDLQSCRKTVSAKHVGLVSFEDEDGMDVVISDESGRSALSAYPLGNGPKEKALDIVPRVASETQDTEDYSAEVNLPLDAHEHASNQQQAVMDADKKSITRIHKPGVKIKPDREQNVTRSTSAMIETSNDLVKPPAFDASSVPIPDAHTAKEAPVKRLASINDKKSEIYWDGKDIQGDIKPQMSQSYEQARKTPAIVPRIDTMDTYGRIDITNQNVARTSREVSNQELEYQLKNTNVPVAENTGIGDHDHGTMHVTAVAPVPVHNEILPSNGQTQWGAKAGDSLREVIANWSIQENVELVWDATGKFTVLNNFSTAEGYEQAIAGLLNQYIIQKYDNRPVGQLYIDPQTGEKMLIVQSN